MGINQVQPFGLPPQNRSVTFQQNAGVLNQVQSYGGTSSVGLNPGETLLLPGGNLLVQAGPYSDIQYFDANSLIWRNYSPGDSSPTFIASDGTNFRLANFSGCPVGALITTAVTSAVTTLPVALVTPTGTWTGGVFTPQSGAALPFTLVPSAGGSTWNAFVGGSISTTITITTAGSGYTLAPLLVIVPPANQGNQPFVPATAYCTLTNGTIGSVTVLNQGAGYVSAPTVLVINAPGDTTGTGGVLTATTSASSGLITLITMATPGTALTAVPTFTITSGTYTTTGLAATILMNFSVLPTGTAVAGAGYTVGYTLLAQSGMVQTAATYRNPAYEKNIVAQIQPSIYNASTTVVTTTAAMIQFGGSGFQAVPSLVGIGAGMTTAGGIAAPAVGGYADVSLIYSL